MWNQLQQLPYLWYLIDLTLWAFSILMLLGALIGWWIRAVDIDDQLDIVADSARR